MQSHQDRPASGHVFRVGRKSGPVWYAKYRLPDGRQLQKRIGPAWTQRGRPAAGFFTKRTARAWLDDVLAEARAGTLPQQTRTGVTFRCAAAEWLRYVEEDRGCKPSTNRSGPSLCFTCLPSLVAHPCTSVDAGCRSHPISLASAPEWG